MVEALKNRALVCHLCNNHKSDFISEQDHVDYFSRAIKYYLEQKYLEFVNTNYLT